MNKFYLGLMSQNRKRPHETATTSNGEVTNAAATKTPSAGNGQAGSSSNNNNDASHSSNESSPLSKRSLMSNPTQNAQKSQQEQQELNPKKAAEPAKQLVRMPQKSIKPTQSINLLNAPEEIYYVVNKNLK